MLSPGSRLQPGFSIKGFIRIPPPDYSRTPCPQRKDPSLWRQRGFCKPDGWWLSDHPLAVGGRTDDGGSHHATANARPSVRQRSIATFKSGDGLQILEMAANFSSETPCLESERQDTALWNHL